MTKNRKVVAALACRVQSTRLYAKPLQSLAAELSILDYIISNLKKSSHIIQEICLGISYGTENYAFIDVAKKHNLPFIFGNEKDVLSRLIKCGELLQASDVFRVTSECPFIALEYLDEVYGKHIYNDNDATVVDFLPHGMHFEIYKLEALRLSHQNGTDAERSEYCSQHIRSNKDKFKIEVIKPAENLIRPDVRVTVDYPEDLIVCRELYEAFVEGKLETLCPKDIINYLDSHKTLKALNSHYCNESFFWQ